MNKSMDTKYAGNHVSLPFYIKKKNHVSICVEFNKTK